MIFQELKLPNPGILTAELPPEIIQLLKEEAKTQTSFKVPIKEKMRGYNHLLTGNMEKEYIFDMPESFKTFLSEFYSEYCTYFKVFNKSSNITLSNCWINLQKKNEYNPSHIHTGELSWVSWVSIPYSLENEDRLPNTSRSLLKANSRFEFMYAKLNGQINNYLLDVDNSWEGKVMLFPSYLIHSVYPFYTSDEYRISIAGNIAVDNLK